VALLILFLMAATSHDYWLVFLTPPVWKGLHMALYVAYGLVVMHVALGVMQNDRNPFIPAMLAGGFAIVTLLPLVVRWRERVRDRAGGRGSEGWLAVGPPSSIPDKGARIVTPPDGERIAVFRDGTQIGALSNLCAHQNGPIGEGRITDGCVTCPWHGYQYRLEDGCAPPPFTEKLVTYRVRIAHGVVEVDPRPLPPGTAAAVGAWGMCGRGGGGRGKGRRAGGGIIGGVGVGAPLRGFDRRGWGGPRLQAHHAVQWLARAARAYIPPQPDDEHTNLGWDGALGGF